MFCWAQHPQPHLRAQPSHCAPPSSCSASCSEPHIAEPSMDGWMDGWMGGWVDVQPLCPHAGGHSAAFQGHAVALLWHFLN